MEQSAVACLREMALTAKLTCAPFLIVYVLYIGTVFKKVKPLRKCFETENISIYFRFKILSK